jgi:hypothetical protein
MRGAKENRTCKVRFRLGLTGAGQWFNTTARPHFCVHLKAALSEDATIC